MRPEQAASFIAALFLHALVIIGLGREMARPAALTTESTRVDVNFIDLPSEPTLPPANPVPPQPAAIPEPPAPQPTPEMPTPEPAPLEQLLPTPDTARGLQLPQPSPRRDKRKHPSSRHSAPGPSAALPGSHGGASGPLNSRASYRSNPRPEYPEEARRQRQKGVVLVNVEVGADGHASEVRLAQSSGYRLLDQAALEAVRRWTFDPALVAGIPVSSQVEVPVRFSLSP